MDALVAAMMVEMAIILPIFAAVFMYVMLRK